MLVGGLTVLRDCPNCGDKYVGHRCCEIGMIEEVICTHSELNRDSLMQWDALGECHICVEISRAGELIPIKRSE
jgi:hypothetical protein